METKNNITPTHITEWDYLGWKETGTTLPNPQGDWNVTLLTKINYISVLIHEVTFRGGANLIIAHPDMEPMFDSIPYYVPETKLLGGRYKVEFDSTINPDEIYVKYEHKEHTNMKDSGFMFIPFKGEEMDGSMEEVVLKLIKISDNEEMVNTFLSKSMGVIKVENYG